MSVLDERLTESIALSVSAGGDDPREMRFRLEDCEATRLHLVARQQGTPAAWRDYERQVFRAERLRRRWLATKEGPCPEPNPHKA